MKRTLNEKLYDRVPIPLQNAIVSWWGRRLVKERFGPEYERWREFLDRSERFSPDEMRAYQDERLRAIVAHSYETVPYYRKSMDSLRLKPEDIAAVEDLRKLPILTKDTIRSNLKRMISTALSSRELKRVYTSGTTGDMVEFYWDMELEKLNNACLWRARGWGDFQFGEPYATMLGKQVAPLEQKKPPFWRYNRSWNQLFLSPHHLARKNLPNYIEAMRDSGVVMLDAYPSTATVLARFLEETDDYLPLKCVFTTAEPLLPPDRGVISERFRCDVFDGYSQAERVVYTAECEQHAGHHLFQEYGICEVVDGNGDPVETGRPGRLIGTSLHNVGMPLLRYDVGDVAALSDRTCACGRSLPMLGLVATRQGDIITTPDGRLLPPLMVLRAFKHIEHIHASQLIQHTPTDYTARITTEDPVPTGVAEELIEGLRTRLGGAVNVRVERVDDIPRSANRKFRRVISEVPLDWEEAPDLERPPVSEGASRSEDSAKGEVEPKLRTPTDREEDH